MKNTLRRVRIHIIGTQNRFHWLAVKRSNFFYSFHFSPLMTQETTPISRPQRQPEETEEVPKGPKNKYGDVWTQ